MEYLLTDVTSPERKKTEDVSSLLVRGVRLQDVKHEINMMIEILNKKKGEDSLATRKRSASKLIPEEELDNLQVDIGGKISEILRKLESDSDFNDTDALEIRNYLIAAATLRLGRRSKELIEMQLEEVRNAEEIEIDSKPHFLIKVKNHKNLKHGVEAPIVYSAEEYMKYSNCIYPAYGQNLLLTKIR